MSPRRLSHRRYIANFPSGVLPVQHRDIELDTGDHVTDEPWHVLSATVQAAGERVIVMTCHLKSKLISYPRRQRRRGGTFNPRPIRRALPLHRLRHRPSQRRGDDLPCWS